VTVLTFERFPVDPSNHERFHQLVDGLVSSMRNAPGCLWSDAARAGDDDPSVIVLAEWRTEADADAWDARSDVAAFAADADPLLRGETTRRRFSSAT